MSVNTANAYGRITITEEAMADLFKRKRLSRGVRVLTSGDRIFIDLYVIIKYGVSIEAVAQSLKKSVKYDVERFTGMVVDTINVNVVGIRV